MELLAWCSRFLEPSKVVKGTGVSLALVVFFWLLKMTAAVRFFDWVTVTLGLLSIAVARNGQAKVTKRRKTIDAGPSLWMLLIQLPIQSVMTVQALTVGGDIDWGHAAGRFLIAIATARLLWEISLRSHRRLIWAFAFASIGLSVTQAFLPDYAKWVYIGLVVANCVGLIHQVLKSKRQSTKNLDVWEPGAGAVAALVVVVHCAVLFALGESAKGYLLLWVVVLNVPFSWWWMYVYWRDNK